MLYFSSALFKNLEAYAIVTHPSLVSCSRTAPSLPRDASVWTLTCLLTLKCVFSVNCRFLFFILLKATSCCSSQSNFLSFCSSLRKFFGINFVRWCILPRNDFNCFWVEGFFRFRIACVLVSIGLVPFSLISYQSHVIYCFAKWHLSMFIARFSSSSLSRHLNSFPLWFCMLPPVTIIRLSRKLNVLVRFESLYQRLFGNQLACRWGHKVLCWICKFRWLVLR